MNDKNRAQTRFQEKVNSHLEKFVNSYIEKFMQPDITDAEVEEYEKFLINRWKTYCHVNRLNKPAFTILTEILGRHKETYAKQKSGELEMLEEEQAMVTEKIKADLAKVE